MGGAPPLHASYEWAVTVLIQFCKISGHGIKTKVKTTSGDSVKG